MAFNTVLPDHYIATNCRHCGETRYFTVSEYAMTAQRDITYCSRVCEDAYEDVTLNERCRARLRRANINQDWLLRTRTA